MIPTEKGWSVVKSPEGHNLLYNELAWLWRILSPVADYRTESERFARVIKKYSIALPRTLLNLGCGGGHNDFFLKRHFDLTGVDISKDMLRLAQELNPEVTYKEGDIRSLRLGTQFDAVCCFDSLSYMLAEADLRAAFVTVREHLDAGGIFLTYIERTPERIAQVQDSVYYSTHEFDGGKVTYIEHTSDPDTTDTAFELLFIYVIRRGRGLEIHTDHHTLGVFPVETWLRLLKETGFSVKQLTFKDPFLEDTSYPLLVCQKQ